jgi:branched-chain amino acid transport system substrate-binding protein
MRFKRAIVAATIAASGIALAAAPVNAATAGEGNASGGLLATQAAKLPLIGPKGTGLTRGITKTAINVGCVYSAADYAGYTAGIEARFARANKKGIFGRKINFLGCKDDASTVQTNVTDVQQIVQEQNAFAVFTLTEDVLTGSGNFLSQNQVPFYGWGFNSPFCGYRWGFGWNGCDSPNTLPTGNPLYHVAQGSLVDAIIKASGLKPSQVRFGVQSENSPNGIAANVFYAGLFKARGAKVVYVQSNFPATATGVDYTPYVQAILASNPNIIYISTPFSSIGGFASALKAAGYKGITMDFVTYSPGLLQSSPQLAASLQGEYVNNQTVPQEATNSPWVKQALADLTAIHQPADLTLGASIGYTEAEELIEQLQAVGPNLNTKTFDQTVNGGKFTSFTGITGGPGELKWPAAHFLPSDCAVIVKVVKTSYKVVVPFQCYQSLNLK